MVGVGDGSLQADSLARSEGWSPLVA